jgi:hypothetical protein
LGIFRDWPFAVPLRLKWFPNLLGDCLCDLIEGAEDAPRRAGSDLPLKLEPSTEGANPLIDQTGVALGAPVDKGGELLGDVGSSQRARDQGGCFLQRQAPDGNALRQPLPAQSLERLSELGMLLANLNIAEGHGQKDRSVACGMRQVLEELQAAIVCPVYIVKEQCEWRRSGHEEQQAAHRVEELLLLYRTPVPAPLRVAFLPAISWIPFQARCPSSRTCAGRREVRPGSATRNG